MVGFSTSERKTTPSENNDRIPQKPNKVAFLIRATSLDLIPCIWSFHVPVRVRGFCPTNPVRPQGTPSLQHLKWPTCWLHNTTSCRALKPLLPRYQVLEYFNRLQIARTSCSSKQYNIVAVPCVDVEMPSNRETICGRLMLGGQHLQYGAYGTSPSSSSTTDKGS